MNTKTDTIRSIVRNRKTSEPTKHSVQFGSRVFHREIMEERLSKKAFENLACCMNGEGKLDPQYAGEIADAIKNWAIEHGATHYTHWFQPLTGFSAEKHDSFLSFNPDGSPIKQFRGKDLLRGEPDASSFPSGGLRCTHEARGYTTWDLASPPFLWEEGGGSVLCIPSVFFSWKGEALDYKIPLLRSEEKLNNAALRLLNFCQIPAGKVYSTLGAEQEYFLIDRELYQQRPDLLLAGRTVFGAKPSKGQELEDHYFGALKEKTLFFMREFEKSAVALGIPVKTRHNEVAPAQHEIAPLFERASIASDHNVMLMHLMRQIAEKQGLACLFHEKPFALINGSGKHNNWSVGTDTGLNLLDPKENSLLFLSVLAAILRAVHKHAGLLRASIGSAGNDHRLGGSEAPPTIISVYLGDDLEKLVERIVKEKEPTLQEVRSIDLKISHLSPHVADSSDRNRTSPFAFTGNKFEFRAVGASAHCAFPISIINAIVAESLGVIVDELERRIPQKNLSSEALLKEALPILRKFFKEAEPVLFSGNNYSSEWEKEALKRGLPNTRKSFHSFSQLLDSKSIRVLEGVLSEKEIHSRYEILVEQYAKTMNIETHLMIELFRTQILPAALEDQKNRARSLSSLKEIGLKVEPAQIDSLSQLAACINQAISEINELEIAQKKASEPKAFCDLVSPKMQQARKSVDQLETLLDNRLWPLPKYREILFS